MTLAHRHVQPELMDDPALDPDVHDGALRGLRRLNRISGSADIVWSALRDLALATPEGLRVLDVATGGADLPVALHRRAQRLGIPLQVDGCDLSPVALAHARARVDAAVGADTVGLFRLDALRDPIPAGYDVVTCSLFIHHLTDEDAVNLLRRMAEAARRRVVVNDLVRSRASLALVAAAARLVSRSRVVHVDAVRSVRAALTAAELRALADRAGLADVTVAPRFPCRMVLTGSRA
jgi:2-polyprenyl-3-methyl-5-hydroxy-6-metoxy-1,4-benzoquinol methylase